MPHFWDGKRISGPSDQWPVVSSGLGPSHKLPRAQSCHVGYHVIPPLSDRLIIGHTVRQHNSCKYINQQGRIVSWSLCHLAMAFWELCLDKDIFPMATYIPGTENVIADSLSRQSGSHHKWELNGTFLNPLFGGGINP